MKPKAAINFALNNNIAPGVKILDINWVPTKHQWKIRVFDTGWYRQTIYFDECFIKRCEYYIKEGGATKWCQEKKF